MRDACGPVPVLDTQAAQRCGLLPELLAGERCANATGRRRVIVTALCRHDVRVALCDMIMLLRLLTLFHLDAQTSPPSALRPLSAWAY